MTRLQAVEVADLFEWLPRAATEHRDAAVVAVLPDAMELGASIMAWQDWFVRAARACFAASAGPTVFLQTDRMVNGEWISKPDLIATAAAQALGRRPLLWHKIVLRRDPWKTDLHRPTYSHVLAYGPGRPGRRTPDVVHGGRPRWKDGVGPDAARLIAGYLRDVGTRTVLNPGCGVGTILEACAGSMRVHGCDIDPERAAIARAAVDPFAQP